MSVPFCCDVAPLTLGRKGGLPAPQLSPSPSCGAALGPPSEGGRGLCGRLPSVPTQLHTQHLTSRSPSTRQLGPESCLCQGSPTPPGALPRGGPVHPPPSLSTHQWILWTHPPKHVGIWPFLRCPSPSPGGASTPHSQQTRPRPCSVPQALHGPSLASSDLTLSAPHHLPPGPLPGAPHVPTCPDGPAHACTRSARALPSVHVRPDH